MASLVVVPDLIEFIDNLSIVGKSNINIEEIAVDKLYNTNQSIKTIRDLDLRRKSGCTVIGYKDAKGDYIVNPEAEQKLEVNSKVIVIGRPEQIVRWAQAKLISSETFSSTMQEDIYFWRYSLFDNKLKVLS